MRRVWLYFNCDFFSSNLWCLPPCARLFNTQLPPWSPISLPIVLTPFNFWLRHLTVIRHRVLYENFSTVWYKRSLGEAYLSNRQAVACLPSFGWGLTNFCNSLTLVIVLSAFQYADDKLCLLSVRSELPTAATMINRIHWPSTLLSPVKE
jgi:hypothetical protein